MKNYLRPFKCSVCGETWYLTYLRDSRLHIAARSGSCREAAAKVFSTDVVIRASDRAVGGRAAANILSDCDISDIANTERAHSLREESERNVPDQPYFSVLDDLE
jgi:hypothetical protein